MSIHPQVSVIIPCYNVEPYLKKCLETILNQTLQDIEVICINDGSTDGSALILDEYAKKDERMTVIHQKNQGVSNARNTGIKLAKGEYLGFVAPDDYIDLNFYEKLYNTTEKHKHDIIKGNYKKYDELKGVQFTKENETIRQSSFNYLDTFVTAWWSAIYKRDMIEAYNIKFPVHMKYKEDVAFLFCAKLVCTSFYLVDDVFYTYFQRPTSVTKGGINQERMMLDSYCHIKFRLDFLNIFCKDPEEYCKLYKKHILNALKGYYNRYKKFSSYYYNIVDKVVDCWSYIFTHCQYKSLLIESYPDAWYRMLEDKQSMKNVITAPSISIIIPCYNVETYLKECLDSIINQSLQTFEVICINDGSTDGTLKILQEYAHLHRAIRIIDQENTGVGKARNKGIKLAKGHYISFMDPDDFYPSNDILERLFAKAIDNNVLICGGEFARFYHKTQKLTQDFPKDLSGYLFKRDGLIQYRDYQFDYGFHRFLYNREFLISNSIYFPNYKRFQDPPFFVKAMSSAGSFYAVKKIVYGYRKGHSSPTWNKEKVIDLVKGLQDNYKLAMRFRLDRLKKYTRKRVLDHLETVKGASPALYKTMVIRLLFTREFFFLSMPIVRKKLTQTFFSVTYNKNRTHKVITILGIKIKLRRNKNNAK